MILNGFCDVQKKNYSVELETYGSCTLKEKQASVGCGANIPWKTALVVEKNVPYWCKTK